MREDILVHELVHVLQYEKMGIVYIPRALSAQSARPSYDYGGLVALENQWNKDNGLAAFNLEQQADIISDCFRLQCNLKPRWGDAKPEDIDLYGYYLGELQHKTKIP